MHVMIDIKTLGTRPDAVVIQIGAVLFEPVSGGKILNGADKTFSEHLLICDDMGSIDHGTIAFWLQEKSGPAMGRAMAEDAVMPAMALQKFLTWPMWAHDLDWGAISGVWAMPADFDLPILKSLHAKHGADVPWDRRATRCARTLFQLVGGTPKIDWTGLVAHDALDAAIGQAMQVQKAMAMLGDV